MNEEDYCRCPGCGMCGAAVDMPTIRRKVKDLRARLEAAEGILRDVRNRGVGGWVTSAIDAHFARYEKEPT